MDDQHWDYHKHIGTDNRYTWTFKCQTSKSRMMTGSRPTMAGDSANDGGLGECPVLWVKVDPDYR